MILFHCFSTSSCLLNLVSQDDALVFRQDGVYLLQTDLQWPTTQLYALQQDVSDRQLQCPDSVQLLSDAAWVELCLKAQQVLLC
jgi:sulfur relay protein TusB/DsrH